MSGKAKRSCLAAANHAYSGYQLLIKNLGHILFGRYSLIITSLIVLVVAANVMQNLYAWALTPENDLEEMLREVDAISTLFLGIGLILKERRLLEKIFGTGLGHEDWLNRLCLHVGLCLIVNGTAMRIASQIIRFPDRVVSTQGKEPVIFAIGLIFCAAASLLLVYLIIRLCRGNRCEDTTTL